MAKPIKETPILTGKDAKAFIKKMDEIKQSSIAPSELSKMRENFNMLNSIAKFNGIK